MILEPPQFQHVLLAAILEENAKRSLTTSLAF
jgi:hypothetical protein